MTYSKLASGWSYTRKLADSDWEVPALLAAIIGVAILLRLVNLTSIPTGLHGDEAIVGMEGQRILREGLIDPYSPSARGQPTLPFYLAALTVWLWDNTVLAVRASAVIFGVLAIPALYAVVRRSLGVPVALLSASFLAVMGWHIHYSRIAFPLPAWPFWVVLTTGLLVYAVRARTPGWWAAAGAMSGGGIYVYNAHPLTLIILCAVAGALLVKQGRLDVAGSARNGSAFVGGMVVSLLPMLWFVLNNTQMFFNSITRHSVRQTAEWQDLDGPISQSAYIAEQYGQFWWRLSVSPQIDYVDATGITEVVPLLILALALVGMIIALVRFREPLIWLGAAIVLLMPFATVMTEQGEMRRTLVIAPFLSMFAAVGIVESIQFARSRWRPSIAWAVVAVCAVVISAGVTVDLRNYFVDHAESSTQQWVFADDFYQASILMQKLPEDHYVYFMAERWSIDYEPRRFLAPDTRGEDRSDEFGRFGLDIEPEQGRAVFLLVGDYLPVLEALQDEYPDGRLITGPTSGDPAFIAYVIEE